ncbi:MAG TPA: hypothetical protein VN805_11705 [Caulobacteraceae bacterium]|nr:hypothetical protein [Caulobacteraceae bacterium]
MILGAMIAVAIAAPPAKVVHPEERPAFEALIRMTALGSEAQYGGVAICAEAKVEPVSLELVDIAGRPDIAAVRARVRVTGCGRSSVQNVNAVRVAGAPPWRMAAAVPGDSLADPGLQQNLWPILLAEAGADVPKTCQTHELDDVYVAARPGQVALPPPGDAAAAPQAGRINVRLAPQQESERAKLDVSKAWIEVWPLKMCGLDRTVAIVLIPLRDKAAIFHLEIPMWKIDRERGVEAVLPPAPPE